MSQKGCQSCGAPITVGTCNWCGTVVFGRASPTLEEIQGDHNTYEVLRNVHLKGDYNVIGEAHNCRITGDHNNVEWGDASTLVRGDYNTVMQPRTMGQKPHDKKPHDKKPHDKPQGKKPEVSDLSVATSRVMFFLLFVGVLSLLVWALK